MALSKPAKEILAALTAPDAPEVLALVVQHGAERQRLIDHHQAVIDELRAAGWSIEAEVYPKPDGDALTIGLVAGAPRPDT